MHKTLASLIFVLWFAFSPVRANEKLIQQIENYINNITTMSGTFTQDGPQNQQGALNFSQGKFWISRPGKMRFEYSAPQQMRIIADGVWLAVKPRPGLPPERYPLDATPARFILKENLHILQSANVEAFQRKKNKISLWLSAKDNNLAGKIRLLFRENPLALMGWTIIDAQGFTTEIKLKNIKRGLAMDPRLFFIKDETLFKRKRR
jgi:outer membrane lipoprotein-sorting protein